MVSSKNSPPVHGKRRGSPSPSATPMPGGLLIQGEQEAPYAIECARKAKAAMRGHNRELALLWIRKAAMTRRNDG